MRFSLLLGTATIAMVSFASLAQARATNTNAVTADKGADHPAEPAADPWVGVNHPIFDFNVGFDRNIAKPVQTVYHQIPSDGRRGVSNVLTNLSEPLNTIHGVLQGNPRIAFTSFWRFILNTTFGFAGLRDFAGENGLHNMDQNLGKTFGRWGVEAGPYVVLPILGPSSVRDTVGKVGDFVMDPIGWNYNFTEDAIQGVIDGIDTRDRQDALIDQLYYQSMDPYVATRSAYRQHEAYEVRKKE